MLLEICWRKRLKMLKDLLQKPGQHLRLAFQWPYTNILHYQCRPGSSVGITTGYGLDGPGIKSRWGEIFRTCPDRPWGPPSLLYNGYRVVPRGKERPRRDADPSPPSSAVVKKSSSYTSTLPMGRTACNEPRCLYKGALYLYLLHYKCANYMSK
jgi:hypothetical protein